MFHFASQADTMGLGPCDNCAIVMVLVSLNMVKWPVYVKRLRARNGLRAIQIPGFILFYLSRISTQNFKALTFSVVEIFTGDVKMVELCCSVVR